MSMALILYLAFSSCSAIVSGACSLSHYCAWCKVISWQTSVSRSNWEDFACQHQKRRTHNNPNVQEFLQNIQALRVVHGFCRNVMKEKCQGNKASTQQGLKLGTLSMVPITECSLIVCMLIVIETESIQIACSDCNGIVVVLKQLLPNINTDIYTMCSM